MEPIRKLTEISKQLNKSNHPAYLPGLVPFFIDNLVNANLAHLVQMEKPLQPSSLASISCWIFFSLRKQNLQEPKDSFFLVDQAQCFIMDLCSKYPGKCHSALYLMVFTSKKHWSPHDSNETKTKGNFLIEL